MAQTLTSTSHTSIRTGVAIFVMVIRADCPLGSVSMTTSRTVRIAPVTYLGFGSGSAICIPSIVMTMPLENSGSDRALSTELAARSRTSEITRMDTWALRRSRSIPAQV